MRESVEVKFIRSTEANVGTEKADWIEWTRVEMFYYLLGQGYDVNYERAASPGPTSTDITGLLRSWEWNDENHPAIFFVQVKEDLVDPPRDTERKMEGMASDWLRCYPSIAEKDDDDDWRR